MQEHFDPYQQWLGIPRAEQPPHHYRLLGLAPLEANPDAIRRAAGERAALIRRYQSSQYLAVTNKLLSDISAAAACLLNPQTKSAYDAALRSRLASVGQQAPRVAAVQRPMAPPAALPPSTGPAAIPSAAPAAPPVVRAGTAGPRSLPGAAPPVVTVSPPKKRSAVPWTAVALSLGAVAVVIGVLAWTLGGDDSPAPSESVAGVDGSGELGADPETPAEAGTAPAENLVPAEASPPASEPAPAEPTPAEPAPAEPLPADLPENDPPPVPSPDSPAVSETPAVKPKTTERRGNAEVAVLSATVARGAAATALDEGLLTVGDPNALSLVINLELRNASDSEPLKYFRWDGLTAFDMPVALYDDRDRNYRQKTPVEESYPNEPEADANVYVITEKNFRAKVLQAKKPVLVQIYAPWSDGCKALMPMIDHLSAVYTDKIVVGRLQVTDADQPGKFQLTPVLQRYKVTSIPAVILFHKGKPADGWLGVVPLSTMEEAIDALLPPKPPAYKTLPPGGAIQQRLVFEPPDEQAKALQLTLPGSAVGAQGALELIIPRAMVANGGSGEEVSQPK